MTHSRFTTAVTAAIQFVVILAGMTFAPSAVLLADSWTQNANFVPTANSAPAMATVSGTDTVVLFDGAGITWVHDSTEARWIKRSPAVSPPYRSGAAMAAVSGTDKVVLFGGVYALSFGDTWVYDLSEDSWTQKFPAVSPAPRYMHRMAEVSGTDKVVLFGGYTGVFSDDTWVYDLGDDTWTDQSPTAHPTARMDHAMATVSGTDKIVVFGGNGDLGGYGDTWVYDVTANTWTQQSPAASPSKRSGARMTAVSGTGQIVMFGGNDPGGILAETWFYDVTGDKWTQKSPATPPSPRFRAAMAPVSGTDQIILFGGSNGSDLADTWIYDAGDDAWTDITVTPVGFYNKELYAMAGVSGTDQVVLFGGRLTQPGTFIYDVSGQWWTQRSPAAPPSNRTSHAMAAVNGTDQVVLFGGNDGSSTLGDTWVYDVGDDTWTRKFPTVSPTARQSFGMAAVGGTDQVVLFGGYDGSSNLADTWVYDASENTWTQRFPAAPPTARQSFGMAAVGGTDRVVLFGGYDGTSSLVDTWVYDVSENTWTQRFPAAPPAARQSFGMAAVTGTDQVVLFGGYDGTSSLVDTWVYDTSADTWTQKSPTTSPALVQRKNIALASASGTGSIVMVGGNVGRGGLRNDTWVYSADLPVMRFDPNGDSTVDPADIFYLINYLFSGGPAPEGPAGLLSGDANGDGIVDPADIFFLAHYLYSGGVAPDATRPGLRTSLLREPISGSLSLGRAVRRGGRWLIPVIATLDPGSASPAGVSLRVPLGGDVVASFHPDTAIHPVFSIARESGNGLYCVLAFGSVAPLIEGFPRGVILGEIELGGTAPARLDIDPSLSMFVDADGIDRASVANGRLRLEGTAVGRIEPPGHAPSTDHRRN